MNAPPHPFNQPITGWSPRRAVELILLGLFFALQTVPLLKWAADHDFITFRQDFSETFIAERESASIQATFHRYGLLQAHTMPDGRIKIYTHNVNIGTYYFILLRFFGIHSNEALTLLVLPVFLAGLLAGYLAVRSIAGSGWLALVFLALMMADFANVGAFAFNGLRAWLFFGLFLSLLATHRMVRRREAWPGWRQSLACAAGAFISFGCGYDFFIIVAAICALFILLQPAPPAHLARTVLATCACFAAPFVLRQLEVMYWMGFHTWATDFYVTFAIKVPFASRFIHIPTIAEIDAMYDKAGLFRPPAYPTSDWAGIWQTLSPLTQLAVIPNYGLVGCALTAAGGVAGAVLCSWRDRGEGCRTGRLLAAYLLGAAAGLLVFAPFSLHVYMKHDFPLIAAAVHLAEATAIVFSAGLFVRQRRKGRTLAWAALLPAAFVAANAAVVQYDNARHSKELDFRWIADLPPPAGTGTPAMEPVLAAVARQSKLAFDHGPEVEVESADLAPWILAQARGLLADSALVDHIPDAGEFDRLVYSPGDGWCNLDAREPDLSHQDWLEAGWRHLAARHPSSRVKVPVALYSIATPVRGVRSGDIVHLEFVISPALEPDAPAVHPRLEVVGADGRNRSFANLLEDVAAHRKGGSASLIYNAKFSLLDVYFRAPSELLSPGRTALTLQAILRYGDRELTSDSIVVNYSDSAKSNGVAAVLREPTTGELLAAFPEFRVLKRSDCGVGYAILDLNPKP